MKAILDILRSQKIARPQGPYFLPVDLKDEWEAGCRAEDERCGVIWPPGTRYGFKGRNDIFGKVGEVRFCHEVFE